MQSYKEFYSQLSDEAKRESKAMFDKIYAPYKDDEPLILISQSDDDEKYVRKVTSIKPECKCKEKDCLICFDD